METLEGVTDERVERELREMLRLPQAVAQSTGQTLSATRNDLLRLPPTRGGERLAGLGEATHAAGEFVRSLLEPVDRETGMPNVGGAGSVERAMIHAGANLPKFVKAFKEVVEELLPQSKNLEEAVTRAYLRVRYPKRAAVLEKQGGFFDPDLMELMSGIRGQFSAKSGAIRVLRPSSLALGPPGPRDYIGAATHETQHAMDLPRVQRGVSSVSPRDFISKGEGGTYFTPKPGPSKAALRSLEKYKKQPIEARAIRAEETAQKGWRDFMDRASPRDPKLGSYDSTVDRLKRLLGPSLDPSDIVTDIVK